MDIMQTLNAIGVNQQAGATNINGGNGILGDMALPDSLISGGEGGFGGSSGVSGDDEQSFSSGIGGIQFGDFMSKKTAPVAPTWVWVLIAVIAAIFLIRGGI
jgi:hypothetical protein